MNVEKALRGAHPWIFSVYLLTGVTQLLGWNAMLNGLPRMIEVVFATDDYASTVTVCYCAGILVFTLPFLTKKWVSPMGLHFGMTLSSIIAFSFAMTCQFCENIRTSKALYHIYAVLFALAACFIANNSFGMAAELPRQYGGAVSTGMGLSGLLTFTVWMIATYVVFDAEEPSGVRGSIWTLCVVLIIISPITSLGLWLLYRRKDVQLLLEVKRQEMMTASENEAKEYELYNEEGLWALYKACWVPAVAILVVLGTSLTNFPVIGPLAWKNNSGLQREILVGNFQVLDLIGRYMPNIMPFLKIERILLAACMRVPTVLLFIFCAIWDDKPFWGTFVWQFILMTVMAMTNGWLCSTIFMTASDKITGNKSKQKAMSATLLHSYIGLSGGQALGAGLAQWTK